MKTVIYLSSKQVMILTGDKLNSIKKAYRFEFKESCLINGVITNYDVLKKELGDFVKNNKISVKDVTLVLHSSKVINRNISLPSKLFLSSLIEHCLDASPCRTGNHDVALFECTVADKHC